MVVVIAHRWLEMLSSFSAKTFTVATLKSVWDRLITIVLGVGREPISYFVTEADTDIYVQAEMKVGEP